jgi:hypothetical protein
MDRTSLNGPRRRVRQIDPSAGNHCLSWPGPSANCCSYWRTVNFIAHPSLTSRALEKALMRFAQKRPT